MSKTESAARPNILFSKRAYVHWQEMKCMRKRGLWPELLLPRYFHRAPAQAKHQSVRVASNGPIIVNRLIIWPENKSRHWRLNEHMRRAIPVNRFRRLYNCTQCQWDKQSILCAKLFRHFFRHRQLCLAYELEHHAHTFAPGLPQIEYSGRFTLEQKVSVSLIFDLIIFNVSLCLAPTRAAKNTKPQCNKNSMRIFDNVSMWIGSFLSCYGVISFERDSAIEKEMLSWATCFLLRFTCALKTFRLSRRNPI